MSEKGQFPIELLGKDINARINYFKKLSIAHPHFNDASGALLDAVTSPEHEPLIFVMGPSCVGKSTLMHWLENQLHALGSRSAEAYPERLAYASVEAIASGHDSFRWKDYYVRSLKALKEPLIEKKILYGEENGLATKSVQGYTPALRRSLEITLAHRKPFAFLIDEAQHLTRIVKGKMEEQLDVIKSLANLTGVKHVLFGTYSLCEFIDQSAQLNNRSTYIHFRRYDATINEEYQHFKRTIATLQMYLPVEKVPDLVTHYALLYERTIGCVGLLKKWMNRALGCCLKREGNTISLGDLEKTAPTIKETMRAATETLHGENALTDDETHRNRLLRLLGLEQPDDEEHVRVVKKGNRHPGQQNPHRYPVGKKLVPSNGGSPQQ